jgi:segregation and condensation protein B
MNPEHTKRIIEAVLMVAEDPVTVERLLSVFDPAEYGSAMEFRQQIGQALNELREEYAERGINLVEVASGFRFQTRADLAPWINRLWEERPGRYTRAFLETLAIIAYKQPVTRAEIEAVRGVSVSSNIIRTLQDREWVRVAGHKEVPGRPALYVTTPEFLNYFNLQSLAELPSLPVIGELVDDSLAGDSMDKLALADASTSPTNEITIN